MKNIIFILGLALFVSCKEASKKEVIPQETESAVQEIETLSAEPNKKKPLSPHTSAMAMVGDAHIHIDYSSPGVRKRMIFGGLLPYDAVWQAGAHNATWIETDKDLSIKGEKLPAGKYGFFVIPNKDQWTVIFNSNWNQHGKDDYDEKDDVLRFNVVPKISEEIQEHLEYKVTETSKTSGTISLNWEKVTIEFPFTVN
ncbi:hypothetical protein ULMS_09600 [Patiriisocius marinistellae]|uniref:DUF2911 domain-containing protein n=1 Tax=Patiriisocius marinistellae TaxID=2494560 RepID=A0A5J4FWB4_9FLAO|nr:DUF2911 domain-containing protein [Patiriisocius marinistellae]GEQ85452.1 hypothetical protein ULMS_09600 [Patiriisocius marinistellae]